MCVVGKLKALPLALNRVSEPSTAIGTDNALHIADQKFIPVKWHNKRKRGKNQKNPGDPPPRPLESISHLLSTLEMQWQQQLHNRT